MPPAAAQAPPAQTLAPTTPIKAGASGHAGSSPAPAPGQVGGCQAVTDQKHRLSNCALEASYTIFSILQGNEQQALSQTAVDPYATAIAI